MGNQIAVWNSLDGANIPASISSFKDLSTYIKVLTPREIKKINDAFEAQLYDMATEYAWLRTINYLREKVMSFGKAFVLEMLGRRNDKETPADFLSEVDIINLSADLGFINKTAKMLLLQCNENIKHFSSKDVADEIDRPMAESCIKNCVKYVLSMHDDEYQFSFAKFREKLTRAQLNADDESFRLLVNSPYFFKRTTVRTLLNLAKSSEGGELENVLANMSFMIPKIWNDLLSDDRWPVGFAYSESVSEGNRPLVNALKSVLLKIKGFDYVPENLRSLTFINVANKLLEAHFNFDNFYNEPPLAKALLSLGTSIPVPAIGVCLTAVLACKIGNYYGVSRGAESYLDDILRTITEERWQYYLDQILPVDEVILIKLLSTVTAERWAMIASNYKLNEVSLKNSDVQDLISASDIRDISQVTRIARRMYDKVR